MTNATRESVRKAFIRYAGRFVNANRYHRQHEKADAIADEATDAILALILPVAPSEGVES